MESSMDESQDNANTVKLSILLINLTTVITLFLINIQVKVVPIYITDLFVVG